MYVWTACQTHRVSNDETTKLRHAHNVLRSLLVSVVITPAMHYAQCTIAHTLIGMIETSKQFLAIEYRDFSYHFGS